MHLQCHIGTDTVSLARLGARMTGLDFSAPALAQGRQLAEATGADVEFVESDLYDAADVLGRERFDLVYTGIGALCWLPDIRRWAEVVAAPAAAGRPAVHPRGPPDAVGAGRRSAPDGLLVVEYPYFEQRGADGLGRGRHLRRDRRRTSRTT